MKYGEIKSTILKKLEEFFENYEILTDSNSNNSFIDSESNLKLNALNQIFKKILLESNRSNTNTHILSNLKDNNSTSNSRILLISDFLNNNNNNTIEDFKEIEYDQKLLFLLKRQVNLFIF